MKRLLLAGLLLTSSCAPRGIHRTTESNDQAEALYRSAVMNLDPANRAGTLDAGLANLEAYLASPGRLAHASEANALRSLARSARQLSRVEANLQQARASAPSAPSAPLPQPAANARKSEPEPRARDEEMVKEIQRLKEELAKATEELERIKKRLAAPTKP